MGLRGRAITEVESTADGQEATRQHGSEPKHGRELVQAGQRGPREHAEQERELADDPVLTWGAERAEGPIGGSFHMWF